MRRILKKGQHTKALPTADGLDTSTIMASREAKLMLFLAICNEIKKRSKEKAWKYEPVHKVAKAFHESQAHIRLVLGGNRSGKTMSAANEIVMICRGTHPTSKVPCPAKVWVVGKDRVNYLKPILYPLLMDLIPQREIKEFNKQDGLIVLHNGSEIQMKTMDAGPEAFMSKDLDVLWLDEQPPKEIWDRAKARLADRNGIVLISMTPEDGISWIYDEFYLPWKEKKRKDIEIFEYDTRLNHWLSKDGLAQLVADCQTDEEFQMRILGRFVSFGAKRLFTGPMIEEVSTSCKEAQWQGDFYTNDSGRLEVLEDDSGPYIMWERANRGDTYFIGVDTTEGMSDNTSIQVFKLTTRGGLEQVAEYTRCIPPEYIDQKVYHLAKYYNSALCNIERNGPGLGVISNLMKYYNNLYMREKDKGFSTIIDSTDLGWHSDHYSKIKMVNDCRRLLNDKKLIIRGRILRNEMEAYSEDKKGRFAAAHGKDDRVMAMMLAVQAYLSMQYSVTVPDEPTTMSQKQRWVYGETEENERGFFDF